MSRALVVGTSVPTSVAAARGRKKAPAGTSGTSSVSNSLVLTTPPPPRTPAASKRKAPFPSVRSIVGTGSSSAGSSSTQKRARKTLTAASGPVFPSTANAAKIKSGKSSRAEKPEKRLARFIASPSAATSERITRAFEHRLYLLDKKLGGDDPNSPSCCDFNVLGSTGNVYQVKLQQRPSCTCPDFPRSGLCKHILFVMLRVLKLDRYDNRVWQKALLTSELKELLEIAATSDGVLASRSVRQRFQEMQRGSGKTAEGVNAEGAEQPKTIQREITGDCPICYEIMDDGKGKAKEPVVFCRVCGNNVHRDCFEKWNRSKSSSGGQTTCIYCRAVWSDGMETKKGVVNSAYVNLADVSEPHRTHPSSLEDLYPDSHRWIGYQGRRGRGRARGR